MAPNIEVHVKSEWNITKNFLTCTRTGDKICFHVTVPASALGLDEKLMVSDEWQAKLVKRNNNLNHPFLFSICSPVSIKKDTLGKNLITLECQRTCHNRCQVRVVKFKTKSIDSFHLSADEVVFPKLIHSNTKLTILANANIRIQTIVRCPTLNLESTTGNVIITSEGTIRTSSLTIKLKSYGKTLYVDGIVYGFCQDSDNKTDERKQNKSQSKHADDQLLPFNNTSNDSGLKVVVDGNLHIGTDGKIGCGRNQSSYSLVSALEISVRGDIYNFGIITASRQISLAADNLLSGRNCKDDTVQLYYERIEELHGLQNQNDCNEIEPTTSNLVKAVGNQNAELVAYLLHSGVDPMSPFSKKGMTIKDLANRILSENFIPDSETYFGHEREQPDVTCSLVRAWDKRSGHIISPVIKCCFKGNMDDCSQLNGLEVTFDVRGDITVEEDSIWTSGIVTGKCDGNLSIQGKTKLKGFKEMNVGNIFHIQETGIVLLSEGGSIRVGNLLKNNSVLYVCNKHPEGLLHVTTNVFEQSNNARTGSNSMLHLTILGDTTGWEGKMNGASLCFDIRAKVHANCTSTCFKLCLIKIMEGKYGPGQFCIGKKGSIRVADGKIVVVKEHIEQQQVADVLVLGKLSSEGIHAEKVIINLLEEAFVEVFPDTSEQMISCLVWGLRTKRSSKIRFVINKEFNVIFCKFGKWSHFGEMEVNKNGPVQSDVTIEASTMLQNGKIENCDKLLLTIHKEFINTKRLIVEDVFAITGSGTIYTGYKSVMKCQNGPLSMNQVGRVNICHGAVLDGKEITVYTGLQEQTYNQKWDFKNKGTITSDGKVVIKACNILNRYGRVSSRTSEIRMIWMSQDKTSIEGIVTAPGGIVMSSNSGKHFDFKCFGGIIPYLENDSFAIPEDGLIIECPKGDVMVRSEIHGNSSCLKIVSKKGCVFTRDAFLSGLNVQAEHEEPVMLSIGENSDAARSINKTAVECDTNDASETQDPTSIKRVTFLIRLLKNSRIQVHKTIFITNDRLLETVLRAYECSKFICTKYIIADNSLQVEGLVEFSGCCLIQADVLSFTTDSYCMVSQNEQLIAAQLSMRGKDRLSFAGTLTQTSSTPKIELSAKNIHISGVINLEGALYLNNSDNVSVEGAQISCYGLSCCPYQNHSTSESTNCYTLLTVVNGSINVAGPIECVVKDFKIDNCSTFDVSFNDDCNIQAMSSATIGGKLNFSGQGVLKLECADCLILEEVELNIFMARGTLRAGKKILADDSSVLLFNGQNLEILTSNENDDEVYGEISLSGRICTSLLDSNEVLQSVLEIECNVLHVTGATIEGFKTIDINTASMCTDPISNITRVGMMTLDAANLDAQGQIKTVENLIIKASNILIRGKVEDICTLKVDAEYTAVNCGKVHATHTGIVAPVFLNCPTITAEGNETLLKEIPILGNSSSKQLVVEGLLCIIIGSLVQGTKLTIRSVMRFDFSSMSSTKRPDSNDLDNWKQLVNSSLCRLSVDSEKSEEDNLFKEALQIPQVVCQLGVMSHLCNDIVTITQGIQKQGLGAFQLNDLVQCLNKAHTEYSRISCLDLVVKVIPKKLKKIKNAVQTKAKKIMETIFGPNSFTSTFELEEGGDNEESIDLLSFVFIGKSTDFKTSGHFTSKSLILGGEKGIWKNEGALESCGDIIISAKFIEQGGKQRRLMRSIYGCIQMEAESVRAKSIEGKYLQVKATGKVDLSSVNVEKDACFQGKDIKAKDMTAKNIEAVGTGSVLIDEATADNVILQTDGDAHINRVSSNNIEVEAENNVKIGNIHATDLSAKSKEGNVNVTSKIKCKKAELIAEKGQVSLKDRFGKANHDLKQLLMRTKRFDDIEEMLNKTGAYRDLKTAEEIDLAVDEQSVILANIQRMDFTLKLTAKDIDVQNSVQTSKSLHLNALDGKVKLRENVRVEGKGDVSLTAQSKITLSENACVKAGEDVFIESKESSVSCTAATIEGDNSVAIKAAKNIDILAKGGNGPAKKSRIKAGKKGSSPDTPSIVLQSGRHVNIHASDIISEGENKIMAAKNINITGHTYQTCSTTTESKYWGLVTETHTTIDTHVDKSEITGSKNTFVAGGDFSSTAGKLTSELGQTIRAKGKVSMKDIVTKRIEHKTKDVLGGLLYHRSDHSTTEMSHGTLVEDTSSLANTKIISDTSDIEWTGSSLKSSGQVYEEAKTGSVVHKARILTHSKRTTELGFFTSKSPDDTYTKLGYGFHHSNESNQSVSDDCMNVGSYSVKANRFSALNAFGINVHNDMTLDVEEFNFEGAKLNSSKNSMNIGIELDKTTVTLSGKYSQENGCTFQHQTLDVGGKLRIDGVKKGVFDCSQADVGEIEGKVESLEIISRADTNKWLDVGGSVGIDLVTRKPEFGISAGIGNSERVNLQTNLNVRSSSQGLKVDRLKMKGASMTFDGDVHNFAGEIITEDVKETENNFDVNFSFTRPKKIAKGSKTLSLSVNHMQGKMKNCIASKDGKVDDAIQQKVNTDIEKCREVNQQFGISIKHEFKGKLSKNLAELGKKIGKAAGKEIAMTCLDQVSKELGLPEGIAKSLIDIAQGENPIEDAFDFMLKQVGKSIIPKELVEALEDFFGRGNPSKLVIWICGKADIPSDIMEIIEIILEILRAEKVTNTIFIKLIQTTARYLKFPDEITSAVVELVKCGSQKGNMKESAVRFIKSKGGQQVLKELGERLGVPKEITDLILDICNQSDAVTIGQAIFEFIASRIGLPPHIISAIKSSMKDPDIKTVAIILFGSICKDKKLVESLGNSLNDCKDVKSALKTIFKVIAQHFGISIKIIEDIENILQGKKQPDFQTGVEIMRELAKMVKRGKVKTPKIQKMLSVIEECFKLSEKFSEIMTKLTQDGFSFSACIPIFQLILEMASVPKELCEGLKSVLIDKDLTPLNQWLPKRKQLDSTVIMLAKDILNGVGLKDLCVTLFNVLAEKLKLPVDVTSDLKHILQGNEPQKCLKVAVEIISSNDGEQSMGSITAMSQKLGLSQHQIDVVMKIMEYHKDSTAHQLQLFTYLAREFGVPIQLITGIEEWLDRRDPETLAEWIEKQTGLQKTISLEFLRVCSVGHSIEENIMEFMFALLNIMGLSKVVESLRPVFVTKRCLKQNEKKLLIYKVITGIVSPYIQEFSIITEIPLEIIENLLNFSSPKDQCLAVLRFISEKAGISNELVDALTELIFGKDVDPMARLVADKFNMDPVFVHSVFTEIQNSKSIKSLIKTLPVCFLKHFGLSDETIGLIKTLLSGKVPKCGISKLLKAVILDVANSTFGKKIMHSMLENQGITFDPFKSLPTLMFSDNPLEAVLLFIELLSEQIGISKELCKGISQIVLHTNPSTLASYLVRNIDCQTVTWIQTMLETILTSDNLSDALHKSLSLILKEVGFSPKSVECVLELHKCSYKSNQSNSALTLVSYILGDIAKLCQRFEVVQSASQCSVLFDKDFLRDMERICVGYEEKPERIVLQLTSLFLAFTGINRSVLSGIESILSSGNYESLISLICKYHSVDRELVTVVMSIFSEKFTAKQKLENIAISLIKLSGLSDSTIAVMISLIQGSTSKKTILISELGQCSSSMASHMADVLQTLTEDAEMKIEDLLNLISSIDVPELQNTFIRAITRCACQKDFVPFAEWLSGHVEIEPNIIKLFLESVFYKTGSERIIGVMVAIANFFEIDENIIKDISLFMERKLSSSQAENLMKKLARFVLLRILKIAGEKGLFPEQILQPLIQIVKGVDFIENVKSIASFFLHKMGISQELIAGCMAFVQHRKTRALGEWIASTTGIDSVLIFKLLEPFEDSENILAGVKRLPKQIAQYIGLSDQIVMVMEDLIHGKLPEGDIEPLIREAAVGLLKSRASSMVVSHLSDRFPVLENLPSIIDLLIDIIKAENMIQVVVIFVRFFSPKFEIPTEIIEGFIDLIQNGDHEKLVSWLASKTGIDKKLLMTLAKAFVNKESPITVLKTLAKMAGLPEETVILIEEIIKNKKKSNKHPRQQKQTRKTGLQGMKKMVPVAI